MTVDGRLFTAYNPVNVVLVRSLPQPRIWNDKDKCWNVSLAPQHRARLLEVCDKIGAQVPQELREVPKTKQAEAAQAHGLFPFQIEGVQWLSQNIASHESVMLGDDMGLGKTVQSLMALPADAATLAVVPPHLRINWLMECRKWRPDLTPVIVTGRNNFRIPQPGELVIMGNGTLPDWLEQEIKITGQGRNRTKEYISHVPEEIKKALSSVILLGDEVHGFKNYKSNRSKRYSQLSRMVQTSIHLTGTPVENKPDDLYGILCSCNMIGRTFGKIDRFRKTWGGYPGRYGGFQYKQEADVAIGETLRRVMLRR